MIDSQFIIRYTNALYSTPAEYAPRYDEFRDMFSSGQIKSKEWLIEELDRFAAAFDANSAVIVGAWYGTLGMMLQDRYPNLRVTLLDMDPRCEKFIHNIVYNVPAVKCVTADMYEYDYQQTLIINTSCEHIADLPLWVSLLPKGRLVVLQSNNYTAGAGHVNCVADEQEFAKQAGLASLWYAGKLQMPMYTRFMIIGLT